MAARAPSSACCRASATAVRAASGVIRERMALFLGDILDRGPHIREALHLVHDMVEAGAGAVPDGQPRVVRPRLDHAGPAGQRSGVRPRAQSAPRAADPRNPRAVRGITRATGTTFSTGSTNCRCSSMPDASAWCMPAGMPRRSSSCAAITRTGASTAPSCSRPASRDSFAAHCFQRLLRGLDMPLPRGPDPDQPRRLHPLPSSAPSSGRRTRRPMATSSSSLTRCPTRWPTCR